MTPRNILLITTDEHRGDALGCAGNPVVKTPNLDRLAAEGTRFTRHSCSTPICTPARASMLTGQYAPTHGAVDAGYELPRSTRTLADILHENGFATGVCGKLHLEAECSGKVERLAGTDNYFGFRQFHVTEDVQRGEYLDWVKAHYPELYDEVRANTLENEAGGDAFSDAYACQGGVQHACYKSSLPDEVHASRWIADHSIDFVEAEVRAGRPFFLWTSFVDPHHPWNPIEPWASMYDDVDMPPVDRALGAHGGPLMAYNDGSVLCDAEIHRMMRAYFGMISHIDHHVGRLIDALERAGQLDDTLILFTSDHGDYNGSRGMIRKRAGLYNDILNVPMICRGPGVTAGATFAGFSQHEDIAPTVLELLGLATPESMQGISFAGALAGDRGGREWSYFYNPEPVAWGIEGAVGKYVVYPEDGRQRITEPSLDPLERTDLYGNGGSQVGTQLKVGLCDWMVQTPFWRPVRPFAY